MDLVEYTPQISNVLRFTTLKEPQVSAIPFDTHLNIGASLFGSCSRLKDYNSPTEYTYFNSFTNDEYIGEIWNDKQV